VILSNGVRDHTLNHARFQETAAVRHKSGLETLRVLAVRAKWSEGLPCLHQLQIQNSQAAWDKLPICRGKGKGQIRAQHKQPDAWEVSWQERCLFVMAFTRQNDKI
jgi:hypothetical protein